MARSPRTIHHVAEQFTRLLLLSEHRGPHATGAAWVRRDGSMRVVKAPLPARTFIQTAEYLDWLADIDGDVTYLMGHTRWPTRGSARNNENNHPLWADPCLLSHNGHLLDVEAHFHRLGLPRTAQVDSELLVRLAQRHAGDGGINLPAFQDDLAPLDGRMSCALVATTKPEEIILLRGNMPLEVRVHRRRKLLAYASETPILEMALSGAAGWEAIPCAAGEVLMVNTASVPAPRREHCTLPGMVHQSAWQRFTGV